ncbi:hypothetical protein Cadr_000018010 [Camelus dromedarius]|uniref:Uncharacterized protein n=1 Tax=Camelus dromedarius TaxID=9838 RepID=A0A5N4D722_CAMDR|nr:hypothetical protein Cadr_000018010 [Camelus dromedarius]
MMIVVMMIQEKEEKKEEEEEEEEVIFLSAPVPVIVLSALPNELWKIRPHSRNPVMNKTQLNFAI